MQRLLSLVVFLFFGLMASCAPWSSDLAAHSYLGIHLTTPYPKDDPLLQTLTKNDVEQISELARHRTDIRKPVYEICVTAPGRADVSGGKAESSGDPVTGFKVRKDSGIWKIIDGSVYQTKVLITS